MRQYNLIAVLGNPRRRACRDADDAGGTSDSSTGDAPEGLTLGEWWGFASSPAVPGSQPGFGCGQLCQCWSVYKAGTTVWA